MFPTRRSFCAAVIALVQCGLAAEIALQGVVVDREGIPIPGAHVYLNQDRRPQTTETDADGRFHIDDLRVGRIEVVAEKTGFAVGGLEADIVGSADVQVRLLEPQETRLRVTDKRGNAVAGARVKTMFLSDAFHVSVEDLVPLGFPSYRSDAEGYLVIPDLPKGSYLSLVVQHREFADFRLVTFPVGRELSLPMSPGRSVRGRVLSNDGESVSRARVSLFRVGTGGKREFAEVLTDPEGFFVATVEPEDYYIAVQHPDHATPPPVPVRVTAEGDEPAGEIKMLPPRYLSGRVTFEDGRPAAAVPVTFIIDEVIVADSWTQLDGAFELLIPPFKGLVFVEPPRGFYVDQIVTAHLEDAERGTANPIILKQLPRITGVVRDSDGTPLANALVTSLNLPETTRALTDAQGRFEIAMDRIPFRETLRFKAEHPIRARRIEFDADIDRQEPLDITLKSYKLNIDPEDASAQGNQLDHLVKKPAPEWSCDTWFNSDPITLGNLRGNVVVMTLWGGFPMDEGVPDVVREMQVLCTMLGDVDDVAFIGIHDNGKEPDEIQTMLDKAGITFPVGRDNAESETLDAYNIMFIPQTVVIDKKSKLRYYRVQGRLLDVIKDLRRSD